MVGPPGGGAVVVVLEGAEAFQGRVREGVDQGRGYLLPYLIVAQVPEEPAPSRVGGLVLQGAVQLRRMPHHLVDDEGVEVGVGDHHHLLVRGPERRSVGHLDGVGAQLCGEGGEVGEDDGAVVIPFGENFPAPLVAGEVVNLQIAVLAAAYCDNEALGLGEALVYVGPL